MILVTYGNVWRMVVWYITYISTKHATHVLYSIQVCSHLSLRSTGIQSMLNVVGDKLHPAASDSEVEAEAISSPSESDVEEARWALLHLLVQSPFHRKVFRSQ